MVSLNKVTLEKGRGISLAKGAGFGSVKIELNWSSGQQKKGFLGSLFGGASNGIDLDLGCFVENVDGSKHVIQALGNGFGRLEARPYVLLPGDDRSGGGGEELRINGSRWDEIRRILVYAFIYEGVANWSQADGVATVKVSGHPDVEVRLDQARDGLGACAIAALENQSGALHVTKLGEYFRSQREIDERYGWGFNWTAGRK